MAAGLIFAELIASEHGNCMQPASVAFLSFSLSLWLRYLALFSRPVFRHTEKEQRSLAVQSVLLTEHFLFSILASGQQAWNHWVRRQFSSSAKSHASAPFATFLFCFVGKISARPLPIVGAADGSSSDR